MAQRVAVLGFLNKRNGIVRDIALRPGQAVRIKDAVVRLRACETTAPWENEKLTGAFVQLDVDRTDGALAARVLGLALQGIAVAQRDRASGLRRLAQELRDDISGGPGGAGGAGRVEQPVERQQIRRDFAADGARCAGAGSARARRRNGAAPAPASRRQAPPTTTRHSALAERVTAPSEARWSVMNWQSSKVKPPTFRRATSQASATFEASVMRAEHAFAEEGAAELAP